MDKIKPYYGIGVRHFAYSLFVVTLITVFLAFVKSDRGYEASIGSFDDIDFNEDWHVSGGGIDETVTLPKSYKCKFGDVLTISKNLPDEVSDGMTMMIRSSIEDAFVYVDGVLRESYSSELFENIGPYTPSAYIVVDLYQEDSGKTVDIKYTAKDAGTLNTIVLGYGNTPWFNIIRENYPLFSITWFVISMGVVVLIFFFLLNRKMEASKAILFLGMMMITVGLWLLSESKLRQLIFVRPSITGIFSYLTIELVGIETLLYFDEIQKKRYHKPYVIMGIIICIQVMINIVLAVTGIRSFHETLILSHFLNLVGMILVGVCIVKDIRSKEIAKYKMVATGMIAFFGFCIGELVRYYVSTAKTFGSLLCIGLIVLLLETLGQTLTDRVKEIRERRRKQEESFVRTIETIASTIDAKDEYTGGHSDRVAEYAGILAREMAVDYDFSEADIENIKYIGRMHDIGKIGIADTILNKAGRLNDEEFSLMKKHAEIGYMLLKDMDDNMAGLLDGVRHHHERFDGTGYPDGLSGTDIPLYARILCLADCYDAMTSNRVYRKRLTDEEVREEILRCAGTQFDPALAEIFVRAMDRGLMKPVTVEGLEVNNKGEIFLSALLSEKMQKDMRGLVGIINPSFVRMCAYLVKIAEENDREVDVFFVTSYEDERQISADEMDMKIKSSLKVSDIYLTYSENTKLVAVFDKNEQELKNLYQRVSEIAKISNLKS